jgi:hypothetical protein
MSLTNTQINVTINGGEQNTVGLVSQPYPINYNYNPAVLTDGTGASAAQKTVTLNPTITTSGTTYDLSAVGPGALGANINFTKIKAIVVENTATTAANIITIGAAASSAWEAWTTVAGSTGVARPGAAWFQADPLVGFTVDATHKSLKLIAQSGTAIAKIVIIGEGS